jgi:hypothetical protein
MHPFLRTLLLCLACIGLPLQGLAAAVSPLLATAPQSAAPATESAEPPCHHLAAPLASASADDVSHTPHPSHDHHSTGPAAKAACGHCCATVGVLPSTSLALGTALPCLGRLSALLPTLRGIDPEPLIKPPRSALL